MKQFILFARVFTWWILALPFGLTAQDSTAIYPNYVVIGAFAIHDNAVEFTKEANVNNLSARFEMNPNRNLLYVYVMSTDDRQAAFAEALKYRRDTKYFDTWVYSGPLGNFGPIGYSRKTSGGDFNPETGSEFRPEGKSQTDQPLAANTSLVADPGTTSEPVPGNDKKSTRKKGRKNASGIAGPDAPDRSESTLSADTQGDNQSRPRGQGREAIQDQRPGTNPSLTSAGNENRTTTGATEGLTAFVDPSLASLQTNAGDGENVARNDPSNADTHRNDAEDNATSPPAKKPDGEYKLPDPEDVAALANLTELGRKALAENHDKVVKLGPPPTRTTTAPLTKEDIVGKNFYFHLFRADNLETIDGEVDAIDFEKSRRMATYQGNTSVKVIMPSGNSKQISFVCQVFGYRKQQREFDPAAPPADLYLDDKGNLVVPFDLMRMQKGDIAIMYNVFFFKDAAVMRPESRYEVNNLLALLVENPNYKIAIHGHTNGNASGKIIRMDTPENFYSLSGTKQGFGSAKALSEERATVIRDFLVSSGISGDRMRIHAWGGKKPIHDKHSVRANENVRVEIEILSE